MIIRSALLEGTVDPADQPEFDAYMRNVVTPAIRTYPGIRGVSLRRLNHADDGAPPLYMVFDLLFDSVEAMETALASETRQKVRDLIAKGMAPFKGRAYHIVFDLAEIP